MANIGSFKKVGSDFQGEIVTLSLQAKGVRIVARDQPLQRQRPQPPRLRGPGRDRGRLVEALQRGPRLSLAQARRSVLQRADLREPVRRRGRRRLHPHLVAPAQAQRRLSRPRLPTPRPASPGGAFAWRSCRPHRGQWPSKHGPTFRQSQMPRQLHGTSASGASTAVRTANARTPTHRHCARAVSRSPVRA